MNSASNKLNLAAISMPTPLFYLIFMGIPDSWVKNNSQPKLNNNLQKICSTVKIIKKYDLSITVEDNPASHELNPGAHRQAG